MLSDFDWQNPINYVREAKFIMKPVLFTKIKSVDIPNKLASGESTFFWFEELTPPNEHIVIKVGEEKSDCPLVRLHSECLTGDVFGSYRCDCGPQLDESIRLMAETCGYLVYLRQEGRGIGLYPKLAAYKLQDLGLDTFEANVELNFPEDARSYDDAAKMLLSLNITRCRLITNNPDKVNALIKHGISVVEVIPTGVHLTQYNHAYLSSKVHKKQHTINLHPNQED